MANLIQCVKVTFCREATENSGRQVDEFFVSPLLSARIPNAGESLSPAGNWLFNAIKRRTGADSISKADILDPKNTPFIPSEWVVKKFDVAGNPVYHCAQDGWPQEEVLPVAQKWGCEMIANHLFL